ncbi:efflux RND transporter periplasmic adaptor subunit [Nonlabens tegetincola]|uniref:efflux RND transporter periplasmic adaptor subunit n=1 Tax=Nonlabens tegetincola TaxID=323273 RepID=UPI000CF557DB|nr:efflux RND transporter periplasmic adaptor subunit [Nonlabens tegetincola]PQJ20328.1 efflux transporter periplasmic adaptor subunit [Nonlabens tegetincola]
MKKTLIIIGIIIVVAVLGLIGLKSTGAIGGGDKGLLVETKEVTKMNVTETVSATGKIRPEVEVSISPEVPGEIIELPIKEGQAVKKGDLLVRINPDLLESSVSRTRAGVANARAGYEQAKATLAEATANYNRSKQLFNKGVISQADFDTSTAAYERAKASERSAFYNVQSAGATLNEASDNLQRTSIYAPMSGTISLLAVELGERVVGTQQMAGTELLRVADLSSMEVEVDVNENDIVKIEVGDKAIVEVDAYLKKEFEGVVTEIANTASGQLTADQVTNFKVKVRILPESYTDLLEGKSENYSPFKPGMTATVDIITRESKDIVAVPISSIVVKTDTTEKKKRSEISLDAKKFECVYVLNGNKAKLRVVETGIQDNSNIVVTDGLDIGETIITGPYRAVTDKLKTGKLVRVKKDRSNDTSESESEEN